MVKGCTLPDGLPAAVSDLQTFFDDGNVSPALEFLSPIKGPNLEKITVEVGSGITSAADGAKRYDEDVEEAGPAAGSRRLVTRPEAGHARGGRATRASPTAPPLSSRH